MPFIDKLCSKCGEYKPRNEFFKGARYKDKVVSHCKKCHSEYCKNRIKSTAEKLLDSTKHNARAKGAVNTLRIRDIPTPEVCKYLGVKLTYSKSGEHGRLRSWDTPSIDRIDPNKGYVPENIQVISDLANRMKQNATVEQLLAFAEGVIRVHGDK